ncbi:MAG: CDP-diacylglycerol--glycerol-3-phosphate 3-phosphatidyltransferase [Verrucomicrobiota bacterium]|nr:CDP-diacylglycerol--glycerol-3-phosphate 3-phosphatidyltransferase [Verrucomicrobiota bacterium]MDE3066059.1 CDP-diacylglycerol--glycerol-3-phosphate 3-phosphatidyltransferase [Verrucomicrobiota bacterium]
MNLPNKLTVLRFGLTVVFLWALFWPWPVPLRNTLALLLFCAAGVTDFLDGRIARRRGLITNFGILMDPLADKIMTCSAFIAFVESTHLRPAAPVKVAAWMVVLIVARELAITGLRLLAASKNVILAAEGCGKHKTVSQIAAIIAVLIVVACAEWPPWLQGLFQPWLPIAARLMLWVAVALTAASGTMYLWRNRALYLSEM